MSEGSPTLRVEIVSAERQIWEGEAHSVIAPALLGEIGIFPRHTPLITKLKPGEIRVDVVNESDEQVFYVSGGVLEVQPRQVFILSDTAMRGTEIDEAKAEEAYRLAQQAYKDRKPDMDSTVALQKDLAEAEAQLRLIRKLRKPGR